MPSQLSAALEQKQELVDAIRRSDRILLPMLQKRSQTAKALWDFHQTSSIGEVLTLALTDLWGYAASDFTAEELKSDETLRKRFDQLIAEMIVPRRGKDLRERFEIRDSFTTENQLETFRLNLGKIQNIHDSQLRLHNQVRYFPGRSDRYLLTDFAVEVDRTFGDQVREAICGSGFQIRNDPILIEREGVREAVHELVKKHQHDGQPTPEFAVCFRLQDRETLHLLEVSNQVPEVEDDSLEGIGFAARGIIPHAKTWMLYLIHPNDLRLAFQRNHEHPFFHDLRNDNCEFLFPNDDGQTFKKDFPELLEA